MRLNWIEHIGIKICKGSLSIRWHYLAIRKREVREANIVNGCPNTPVGRELYQRDFILASSLKEGCL